MNLSYYINLEIQNIVRRKKYAVRGRSSSTGAANVVQTPRFVSDVQNLETSVASSVQTPSFPF